MSTAFKRIQKRLNGIGPIPRAVVRYGTLISCVLLLFSAFLFRTAETSFDRSIAAGVLDGGVWVFAESVIGGLLMQSYAERHPKV